MVWLSISRSRFRAFRSLPHADDKTAHSGKMSVYHSPGHAIILRKVFEFRAHIACRTDVAPGDKDDNLRGQDGYDCELEGLDGVAKTPPNISLPPGKPTIALL